MTKKNTGRESNLELLRIVSIAMIIGLHYFNGGKGGALANLYFPHYNSFITYFLESSFIVAVNCFILITGFFQIKNETISIKKVASLFLITSFYSALFYLIYVFVGRHTFNLLTFSGSVLPLFSGQYWFIKTYLILYILSPYLNMILNKIDKKSYEKLLLILLLLFSVWPSLLTATSPNMDCGLGIISFTVMYAIGGYLKKYFILDRSKYFYLLGYLIVTTVIFAYMSIAPRVGLPSIAWNYNCLLDIISSVFLFLFFSRLKLQSKIINYIASFVLSIYVIHENTYISAYIYSHVLHTQNYWFSPLFTLHMVASVTSVFAGAMIIDIARAWIFSRVRLFSCIHYIQNSCQPFCKKT